jgi:hypothetical protein
MTFTLERVAAADRFRDYCLWDYAPRTPPVGKLNSANLLWKALEVAGEGAQFQHTLRRLRDQLGPFQTVYGVKAFGERLSFEFYFYDYARLERRVSLPRVASIVTPHSAFAPAALERRPYFMFSLDLDGEIVAGRRPAEAAHVYFGNPGSNVSSGVSYDFTRDGLALTNLYFFFDRRREWDDIAAKVACSAHHDLRGLPLDRILRPELTECEVVVVANKRLCDGVYFSRLAIDPLIGFLQDRFPAPLAEFARIHRDALSHMLYDVGIDYRVAGGQALALKSAFYGLL